MKRTPLRPTRKSRILAIIPPSLTGININVKISDILAEISLKQKYKNQHSNPVEITYEFPIKGIFQTRSSISHFEVSVDGKVIQGRVEEIDTAKDIYDDSISSGHGAYLMEETPEGFYRASLGNLPPGKEAELCIKYQCELQIVGDALFFSLPPSVLPSELEDYLKRNPETVDGLTFDFEVRSSTFIKGISSPTHPVSFQIQDEGKATVKMSTDSKSLDKNFDLLIKTKDVAAPKGYIARDEKGNPIAAMVSVCDDVLREMSTATEKGHEVIFLVDRSGSMKRENRIVDASQALLLFLRSLPSNTFFNIIGFGTDFESLWPKSVRYGDQTLQQATQHAQGLKANLHETNIAAPLKSIFAQPAIPNYTREVIILTDGAVNNPNETIQIIEANCRTSPTRVFTIGIGRDVSHFLVNTVAKRGNGTSAFVAPHQPMQSVVIQILKLATSPSFRDISIDWGRVSSKKVRHVSHSEPVYNGRAYVGYALLDSTEGSLCDKPQAVLSATGTDGKRITYDVSFVDFAFPGDLVARFAAQELIRDLESQISPYKGDARYVPSKDQIDKQVLELALEYKLSSSRTAFVAVEKRKDSVEGSMKSVKVRGELASSRQPVSTRKSGVKTKEVESSTFGALHRETKLHSAATLMRDEQTGGGDISSSSSSFSSKLSKDLFTKTKTYKPLKRDKDKKAIEPTSRARKKTSDISNNHENFNNNNNNNSNNNNYNNNDNINIADIDTFGGVIDCVQSFEISPSVNSLPHLDPVAMAPQPSSFFATNPYAVLNKIALGQTAIGHWVFSASFCASIGLDFQSANRTDLQSEQAKNVWATFLALHALQTHLLHLEADWELLATKATTWLESVSLALGEQFQELDKAAEILVAKI